MIRDVLTRISNEYLQAKQQPFTGHGLANYVRTDAPAEIAAAIGNPLFTCKGSVGQSTWADVPWIGIYHPNVTSTATEGYYVVYLFDATMAQVHLTLAQGATKVREEFRTNTYDALRRFAGVMRDRLPEA